MVAVLARTIRWPGAVDVEVLAVGLVLMHHRMGLSGQHDGAASASVAVTGLAAAMADQPMAECLCTSAARESRLPGGDDPAHPTGLLYVCLAVLAFGATVAAGLLRHRTRLQVSGGDAVSGQRAGSAYLRPAVPVSLCFATPSVPRL